MEVTSRDILSRDNFSETNVKKSWFNWYREPEEAIFVSQHHTRCEQWSTLREMLPSRGRAEPEKQPNWGTGRAVAPSLVGSRASRFPVYDSEMTRSVRVNVITLFRAQFYQKWTFTAYVYSSYSYSYSYSGPTT